MAVKTAVWTVIISERIGKLDSTLSEASLARTPLRRMQLAGIMLGSRRNSRRLSFHDGRQDGRLDSHHLGLYR